MKRVVGCLAVALSGCATTAPTPVVVPQTIASDKSYTLALPIGWIQQTIKGGTLLASRNGFLLEVITVTHRSSSEAFPRTKTAASATLLPSELAERELAESKAQDAFMSAASVIENEPATIDGRDGFKLHLTYRNNRGLEMHRVIYGVADATGYYRVALQAPGLYYFWRYAGEFEGVVASVRLARTK